MKKKGEKTCIYRKFQIFWDYDIACGGASSQGFQNSEFLRCFLFLWTDPHHAGVDTF
jgi:hypothetical protein